MKIEGYWYHAIHSPEYPLPIKDVLTEKQAEEIYNKIKQKEKTAQLISYRGFSSSRIDGSRVGSQEYQTKEWLWPAGFAEHYVRLYKVKPSDEFLKYINYALST